jgi:superfamily II DNA or RNA helicase
MFKGSALHHTVKLQPHQQKAVELAKKSPGVLINHGLGSGKTLTSLAIAEEKGGNALVVVPASLQHNYKKELQKFVDPSRHNNYHIVSYDKFRKDPEKYVREHKPSVLIADEFHRARNAGVTRDAFKKVRRQVPTMVGLTGSLVSNHPGEIVPLANLVAGQKVYSSEDFEKRHIGVKKVRPGLIGWLKGVKPGEVKYIKDKDALKKNLSPYVHRFTGSEEYRKNLPKAEYEDIGVAMSKEQVRLTDLIGEKNPILAYKIRKNLPPSKREVQQMNSFLMGMRQVANSPASHDERHKDDPTKHSPKMKRMAEEMHRHAKNDPNFRGVLYSRFLDSGVRPVANKLQQEGVSAGTYEGSISQNKRKQMIDDFHDGKQKVLAISPAGGEGIDLKGVKLMQVMEPDWNPETTAQAIGRSVRYKSHAHLPENERKVKIQRYKSIMPKKWYKPLAKRDTSVDEYISARAREKEQLNRDFYSAFEE